MTQEEDGKPSPSEMADLLAMVRVLGTEEIRFVGSLTAPLFWTMRDASKGDVARGGSMFFLDTGMSVFGVTAAHVVTACLEDGESEEFVQCMIGRKDVAAFPLTLKDRVIACHEGIDIATLRFSAEEVRIIGRTVLTGFQRQWPPRPISADNFVTYAGWPGVGRRWLAAHDLSFGLVAMAGKVTSAHETCVSIQIERDALERTLGDRDMPEDFDFGGMSGGPALEIVQRGGLRGWMLAGVIFQGPNPTCDSSQSISGLEVIRIRPGYFINDDGTLNVARWEQSHFS